MAGAPSTGQARVRYFAVWAALQSHPKWMPLSMESRGAWTTLAIIACSSEPRGAFRDRAHAEMLLRRDGAADPPALVAQLIAAGLLDEDDAGLRFHDWSDWQRKPSDMPDAVAERVQRHRDGQRNTPDALQQRHVTPRVTPQKDRREESSSESSTPDRALSRRASVVVDQEPVIRALRSAIDAGDVDELDDLMSAMLDGTSEWKDRVPDDDVIGTLEQSGPDDHDPKDAMYYRVWAQAMVIAPDWLDADEAKQIRRVWLGAGQRAAHSVSNGHAMVASA